MIGNIWFALLAFILGAGLTYLRMAGSATRQIAKPVPRRLVMGGIIPGLVDPPADALPVDVGPEWKIRVGAAKPAEPEPSTTAEPAADETAPVAPEATDAELEVVATAAQTAPAEAPDAASEPIAESQPALDAESSAPATAGRAVAEADQPVKHAAEAQAEASEPAVALERQIAAGATDEPPTSSWWAAAFDRGDPGPYPGPLRYSSAWPPAGSRVLEVDDEFAAALGAGAAASAASAALFGRASRFAAEPEPVRPERGSRTPLTVATPATADPVTDGEAGPGQPDSEPTEAPAVAAAEPVVEAVGDAGQEAAEGQPEAELIKGNRDSMLYHTPDSPWYARTKAEEWFRTEPEAQAAGYERWNSRIRGRQD